MKQTFRILIVEDDPELVAVAKLTLSGAGYRVLEAEDGIRGLECALTDLPDLVLLDVMLPKMSGFDVCAALRAKRFERPILMLTTRNEVADRVKGLNQGADDYLAKPFDARELLARIHALLRRFQRFQPEMKSLRFGAIAVDLSKQTASRDGEPLPLTRTECALLEMLASTPGEPVSREQMLASIWGYTHLPHTRTVDTHVYRLRKKLGDDPDAPKWIKSLPGRGYVLIIDR